MQANSEISVLHLTNDRRNCSGLLLISIFMCVLLGLLYEGRYLSLSARRKITVNVFLFNVYKRFLFLSRFLRFLTFFYFLGGGTFFSSMI